MHCWHRIQIFFILVTELKSPPKFASSCDVHISHRQLDHNIIYLRKFNINVEMGLNFACSDTKFSFHFDLYEFLLYARYTLKSYILSKLLTFFV